MIVRVLTAKVPPGDASRFNALIRGELPTLRAQPGLVYLKLARRFEPDGTEEVVLFEEWRDPQAMYAWAGPDVSRPRLPPESAALLLDIRVDHYEALDREGGEPPGPPS